MAHRDFDQERRSVEPITFRLGDHTFTCRREIAPESVLEYEALDENVPLTEALPAIDRVIETMILPDDVEHWRAARDPQGPEPIGMRVLGDLAAWLTEQVSGRPTVEPSSSSDGSTDPATGTTSTDESLSPVAVASVG